MQTSDTNSHSKAKTIQAQGLLEVVANDLGTKLKEYSSDSEGLNQLSTVMDISKRTLQRVLKSETKPTFHTLYKIYRFLLNTENETELLQKMPNAVKAEVLRCNPSLILNKDTFNYLPSIEDRIISDFCFRYIYSQTMSTTIHKETISYKFGEHGSNVLNEMLECGIIDLFSVGEYKSGTNRARLTGKSLKLIASDLIGSFFSEGKCSTLGENYITNLSSSLNLNGYNEWLKIDFESYKKKMIVANDPKFKGKIPSWNITVTDTLSDKYLSDLETLQ